jgi:hypothetical protein
MVGVVRWFAVAGGVGCRPLSSSSYLLRQTSLIISHKTPERTFLSTTAMAALPFPIFVSDAPVDADVNRAALSAVGRCRVHPAGEEYKAICAKNKEQAMVDVETEETKEENKKLKKKYMKQGVAMASSYLNNSLQLDVSILQVEIVVDAKDIIETDGCLAACLLDAGCAKIVINGLNLEALDAAKIPKERVVAHFNEENDASESAIQAALPLATSISVEISTVESATKILSYLPDLQQKAVFQLKDGSVGDALYSMVAELSKICKDGKGSIGLVDPSAIDLGLSFAACMKTDRDDGLYTTVVCTRSGEALGLVYSSKVGELLTAVTLGRMCTCVSRLASYLVMFFHLILLLTLLL